MYNRIMSNKLISKKLIVVVPIIFFIIAFIRIYINYNENVKNVKQFVLEQSKLIDSIYITHRNYYQNLYINNNIKLDEDTLLGLPSYSAAHIGKTFSDNNKLKIKIKTASDIARNPNNQADIYELQAINYFRVNKNDIEYFNEYDDFFQYATPL